MKNRSLEATIEKKTCCLFAKLSFNKTKTKERKLLEKRKKQATSSR
jgi:hypothetical protein